MALFKWYRGVHWGKHKENGIWVRSRPYHHNLRYRMWINYNGSILFVEIGYLQISIVKPGRHG